MQTERHRDAAQVAAVVQQAIAAGGNRPTIAEIRQQTGLSSLRIGIALQTLLRTGRMGDLLDPPKKQR
jgi:hypothetical protein